MVATAAEETRELVQAVTKALRALRYFEGRVLNGHGEPSDPSAAYSCLREAGDAIADAQQAWRRAREAGFTQHDD